MKYFITQQNGFSLVETLVAISILLLVIIGPMTISSSVAKSSTFSSEQVIAFFLAQEGAELAQKARDDLLLPNFPDTAQTAWDDYKDGGGTYADCFEPEGCGLELIDGDAAGALKAPVDCTNLLDCKLFFDETGGRSRYTYTVGTNDITPYTRVITMEERVADQEIKVTSKVRWQTSSLRQTQEVEVVTYLFNVYGN